jgi:hypothetical protein
MGPSEYDIINFYNKIGVFIQIEISFLLSKNLALGFNFFNNINSVENFAGGGFFLRAGKLK